MLTAEWKRKDDLLYISIPAWEEKGVCAAFSSRQGGKSAVPYDSLNLGLHVGDQHETVLSNRQRFLHALELELDDVVCCQQVHGSQVAVVGDHHRGLGAYTLSTALADYDAMITKSPGLVLMSFYADCIPIFFFDPIKQVIGLAHAGWKGTMAHIAAETVRSMKREFQVDPADIQVFIGPGIDQCCFEIKDDLKAKVQREFTAVHDIIIKDERGYFWDLKATNRKTLLSEGILPQHILSSKLCTRCEPRFYSYRRDLGNTGRMGAVLALRD